MATGTDSSQSPGVLLLSKTHCRVSPSCAQVTQVLDICSESEDSPPALASSNASFAMTFPLAVATSVS